LAELLASLPLPSGSLYSHVANDGGAAEANEGDPTGSANLEKVDHVVVVMLENRSFDHMLGHLSLIGGRPEIDGLRPGLANEYQGRAYPVHHLVATAVQMDPDHSASAIDRQIADGTMSGFVASAAAPP
jgi:phospholipase C